MVITTEKKDRICKSYNNLMSLLQEGESANSVLEMTVREDSLGRWEEPSDDIHSKRVFTALDELLSLAEVTESYRARIRQGVHRIYGPSGAPPNFLISLISGVLHMKERQPEIKTDADLYLAIQGLSEREARNLLTTGMRNYNPENLTMDLFDPEKAEDLEKETFLGYERANKHNPEQRPFIEQWKRQLDERYRLAN